MFKINDYVMYGITGVCKILDIKEEKEMKTAERLLNEEFAIILNISPDEVNSYIAEKMSQ